MTTNDGKEGRERGDCEGNDGKEDNGTGSDCEEDDGKKDDCKEGDGEEHDGNKDDGTENNGHGYRYRAFMRQGPHKMEMRMIMHHSAPDPLTALLLHHHSPASDLFVCTSTVTCTTCFPDDQNIRNTTNRSTFDMIPFDRPHLSLPCLT